MKILAADIVTQVLAQSGAGIAQPTFTTDLNFNNLGGNTPNPGSANPPPPPPPSPLPSSYASGPGVVKLTTDSQNFAVGSQFYVTIDVDSGGQKLSSYSLKIQYDPSLLQVQDSDPNTPGLQINFLDTVFTQQTNTVNQSSGSIVIAAQSTIPTALSGTIAKISFIGTKTGTDQIQVSTTESSLVNDSSANILTTANGLAITVGQNIGIPGQIIQTPLSPVGNINNLPKSGLPFEGIIYILIGCSLIYLGVIANKLRKKKKKH